jgi:hypothetical protein
MVKDHVVYRLLYDPTSVDYKTLDLNTFINIKSRKIVDNALSYGGYTLYKRVRKEYEKNRDIILVEAFRRILEKKNYRQIYNEEREESKKDRKKRGTNDN